MIHLQNKFYLNCLRLISVRLNFTFTANESDETRSPSAAKYATFRRYDSTYSEEYTSGMFIDNYLSTVQRDIHQIKQLRGWNQLVGTVVTSYFSQRQGH